MKTARNSGFTLIELMTVIAIGAILVVIAIPSMKGLIERNAVAGHTNSLIGTLNFARAEAIKRNTSVVVCRAVNAETTNPPQCASGGADWKSGWIVFSHSGTTDQFEPSNGDVLLRVQGEFTDSGGIEQNSFKKLRFRNNGLLASGLSQFTMNSASLTASQQRRVCVSKAGRTRLINNDVDLCN